MALMSRKEARALLKKEKEVLRDRKERPRFDLNRYCFSKQIEFNKSLGKRNVLCTSGRAGKSVLFAARFVDQALKTPRANLLFIGKTRSSAKRIVWDYLKDINRDYKLEAEFNETELVGKFKNEAKIHLIGLDKEKDIEKIRGVPWLEVYIDEGQTFGSYLKRLILDVLSPRLMDYDGTLSVGGTPSPVKAGMFWKIWSRDIGFRDYRRFSWTIFDNPYIQLKSGKPPEQLVAEECERRGVDKYDASIQREFYAQWVDDFKRQVYRYDANLNTYDEFPSNGTDWLYVGGIDLGYHDSDAINIWAFSRSSPVLYQAYEYKKAKSSITDLAHILNSLNQQYRIFRWVADTGGLGKKIVVLCFPVWVKRRIT